MADKNLTPEGVKQSYNSTIKKTSKQIKKWAKNLKRNFHRRQQMNNKHKKMLHVIREVQIKVTNRYNFTPTKMTKINLKNRQL